MIKGTCLNKRKQEEEKMGKYEADVTICVITDQGNVNQIEMHTEIQAKCNETVVADWSI